jgi:hypothetical protein
MEHQEGAGEPVHEKVANQSNSELPEFESNSESRTTSYSN